MDAPLMRVLRSVGILLWLCAGTAQAADWEWSVVPYVWVSDLSLDVTGESGGQVQADLDFSDILDKLDFATQMHIEGKRGRVGFLLDLTYLALGDKTTTAARPPLPGGTEIKSDVKNVLFEAGGFLRPFGEDKPFDLLLGVRAIGMDVQIDVTLPEPAPGTGQAKADETLIDVFAGARFLAPLNERWYITLRGDVATGDTKFTWNTIGLVGYQFGREGQYGLLAGYRHMDIETKDSDGPGNIEAHLTMSGPIAGFMFRF